MSTATGYICLIYDPVQLSDQDIVDVCNRCALGITVDPAHLRGEYLCTYQAVECPLCGRTSIRTRPRVRRS